MDPGSDDFEDDDLFNDPSLLAEVEAHAISSTQAQRPGGVDRPGTSVSGAAGSTGRQPVFGYTKSGRPIYEPQPVNTEPRVSKGAFGWGDLGKFNGVSDLKHGDLNGYPRRQQHEEQQDYDDDDHHPETTMDAMGRYGYGSQDEAEVIDKRAQTLSESLAAQPRSGPIAESSAQARRRAALLGGPPATGAAMSRPQESMPPPARLNTSRAFSRSTSAGPNLFARPGQAHAFRMEPILSQGSQGTPVPASQGAAARKAVFALEEETRKRELAEKELAELRAELERERNSRRSKEPAQDHWPGLPAPHTSDQGELLRKFQELETQLWSAKGEAETIRRAHKNEQERQAAEVALLKRQIADKEQQAQEQARDTAQQLESIKTQAVFNNHAAWNSAVKARPVQGSQQMPFATPRRIPQPAFNGSPKRQGSKDHNIAPLTVAAKPNDRGFPGLVNAFGGDIKSVRKRPRVRSPSQAGSPTHSPGKRRQSPRSSPVPHQPDEPPFDDLADDQTWRAEGNVNQGHRDLRGQLLHHLFSYSSSSTSHSGHSYREPDLYVLLRRTATGEAEKAYHELCAELLRTCGEIETTYDDLLRAVGECLLGIAWHCSQSLATVTDGVSPEEIQSLVTVLRLFASTATQFEDMVNSLTQSSAFVGNICDMIARKAFGAAATEQIANRVKTSSPSDLSNSPKQTSTDASAGQQAESAASQSVACILADAAVAFAEAVCAHSDSGARFWLNGSLALMITSLARLSHDARVIGRAVELFWTAALFPANFRALMVPLSDPSSKEGADQPVVDDMARLLGYLSIRKPGEDSRRMQFKLIRAFWALSLANGDAVLLVAQKSPLVPILVQVLLQESAKIWGADSQPHLLAEAMTLIEPALRLLHHLTFPLPFHSPSSLSSTQPQRSQVAGTSLDLGLEKAVMPQGVNLAARLSTAALTREFNGIHHSFQAALGPMAYAEPELPLLTEVDYPSKSGGAVGTEPQRALSRDLLRSLQYLSQDLIEATMEGPEVDAVYELYADVPEPLDHGPMEDVVDQEAYNAAMNVDED